MATCARIVNVRALFLFPGKMVAKSQGPHSALPGFTQTCPLGTAWLKPWLPPVPVFPRKAKNSLREEFEETAMCSARAVRQWFAFHRVLATISQVPWAACRSTTKRGLCSTPLPIEKYPWVGSAVDSQNSISRPVKRSPVLPALSE